MIHSSAQIDSSAEIDDGVSIGPYTVIGPKCKNKIWNCHRGQCFCT